jgi:hypothetical protein
MSDISETPLPNDKFAKHQSSDGMVGPSATISLIVTAG